MDLTLVKNKDTVPPLVGSAYKIVSVLKIWMKAPKSTRLEEGKFHWENANLFSREFGKLLAKIITKRMESKQKMVRDSNKRF